MQLECVGGLLACATYPLVGRRNTWRDQQVGPGPHTAHRNAGDTSARLRRERGARPSGGTSTMKPQRKWLFIGDSVTETDRFDDGARNIGNGYVHFIAEALAHVHAPIRVVNRGVAGDRVRDLQARWRADCLRLRPDLVSIAIGINDTWCRYSSGDPTTTTEFANAYRSLLEPLQREGVSLVLIEPFLLPVSDEQRSWREDLDPKVTAVAEAADEFGAVLVPADRIMNAYARHLGAGYLAADGVHPTREGHTLLAKIWRHANRRTLSVYGED